MNTNQKGNIALGKAIEYFTSKGLVVSVPLTDSQPYDLVVDIQGILYKVQTKYTDHKSLRAIRLSLTEGAATADGNIYIIPLIDILVSNAITLTNELKEKYKAER
jgi:hypothetical protein